MLAAVHQDQYPTVSAKPSELNTGSTEIRRQGLNSSRQGRKRRLHRRRLSLVKVRKRAQKIKPATRAKTPSRPKITKERGTLPARVSRKISPRRGTIKTMRETVLVTLSVLNVGKSTQESVGSGRTLATYVARRDTMQGVSLK